MTLGLAFYILMLFWLVGGGYVFWGERTWLGVNLLLFLLLLILGWHDFGPPIHG